jgi:hypothetical protein
MKRTLKRGETYKTKDGIFVHDSTGKVWVANQKRRDPYVDKDGKPIDPVFEVSEETFKANPSIWVMTDEERVKAKADVLEKEKAWWKLRGKEMPENLENHIRGSQENKMVQPETAAEPPKRGRPRNVEVKA